MGEASDYEQMMEDIGRAAAAEAEAAAAALEQQYQDKEAAYVNGPQKYWQLGCPFNLKDIVVVVDVAVPATADNAFAESCEAKVIGLPTREDGLADNVRAGHVWVHFSDGRRAWVLWSHCKTVRRSPKAKAKAERTPVSGSASTCPLPSASTFRAYRRVLDMSSARCLGAP